MVEIKFFLHDNDYETNFLKFDNNIINQPELSELLYFAPGTKKK